MANLHLLLLNCKILQVFIKHKKNSFLKHSKNVRHTLSCSQLNYISSNCHIFRKKGLNLESYRARTKHMIFLMLNIFYEVVFDVLLLNKPYKEDSENP